jgi:hypothetical protein
MAVVEGFGPAVEVEEGEDCCWVVGGETRSAGAGAVELVLCGGVEESESCMMESISSELSDWDMVGRGGTVLETDGGVADSEVDGFGVFVGDGVILEA